jgi:hypothetical protein|tara:strand:+ start:147 stop:269 length:123 start_codon:yes stop_codon:yes gene_type:complete
MGKKDGKDRELLNSWGLLGPRSTLFGVVLIALLVVVLITS